MISQNDNSANSEYRHNCIKPGRECRIYIASSWKNSSWLSHLAKIFREDGHLVDLFCEPCKHRTVFNWEALIYSLDGRNPKETTIKEIIDVPRVVDAFEQDKTWLDWCDVVIMVLPCGRSAHLEAGYGKGSGKELYIIGDFAPGEFDLMYRFADGIFEMGNLNLLRARLLDRNAVEYRQEQRRENPALSL